MFEELKKLGEESKARQADIHRTAREQVAPTFEAAFKELIVNIPEIHSLRWSQYAPYFNDGDACVFHVRELTIKSDLEDLTEEDSYYDDGYFESYDFTNSKKLTKKQVKSFESFHDHFNAVGEELMKLAFGESAKITITRAGIEVDEADDHD